MDHLCESSSRAHKPTPHRRVLPPPPQVQETSPERQTKSRMGEPAGKATPHPGRCARPAGRARRSLERRGPGEPAKTPAQPEQTQEPARESRLSWAMRPPGRTGTDKSKPKKPSTGEQPRRASEGSTSHEPGLPTRARPWEARPREEHPGRCARPAGRARRGLERNPCPREPAKTPAQPA